MNYEDFKKDWRNMGQLDYLFGETLKFADYSEFSGDHEHCEFCSEKIANLPDALHEGYCTTSTKYRYWICASCFEDFKDLFEWYVEK